MFYQSPTLINQPFSIQHQSTTTSITPYGTFLEGIFEKSLYLNRHYFNKLKLDFINLKWHLVEARFLLCLQQLPQSQKHNKEVEVITMVYNFDRKKQELTGLLALIREGQATLEDARERLVSERVKLLEPTEKQRNIIKAMELLLEEKQTNLVNLTKSYIGSEGELTIKRLANEKSQGFPWLAKAYDDYFRLKHSALAEYLEQKPQPALKAAEELRQISKERREAEQAARLAQYLLDYCRFLAPWLDEYIGMEVDELDQIIKDVHSSWQKKEEELDEEVKRWIGPSEWEKLAPTERLQRKLDWYWKKPNKSNWQLGRDYERYIGYLYEQKGWNVYYHGKKGYEDLGRDLICKKGNSVEIVQCKYWAREKVIHEKHVYYLFGTTVEYFLENFGEQAELQLALFPSLITRRNVMPKLITTVQVSPKAGQVAKVLKVSIEKVPFQRYPSVKCNVSRRTGERIYHLPFDQQYDAILIEEERLERYAETVAEAEALGFRHAYRWKGETTE